MPRSLLLALTVLLFAAPAAQAACPDQPLSRPFTPWLDYAQYFPAPQEGWTLAGGASSAGGALSLPAGASAVSPPVCVTPSHPSLRFFTRGTGVLATSVLWNGLEVPVGTLAGLGTAWTPSPIQLIVLNLLSDGDIRLRFTSVAGTVEFTDLWIDPYSKG